MTGNMESVLVLGASSLQVPLIKYLKSRKYRVIVVSIPGNYPGFNIADRCVYLDVRDAEGIYSAVSDENVVAVLTDETDISVPTVARLCDKLKLPGNDVTVANIYSNKYLMRNLCAKVGVSVPMFCRMSSRDDVRGRSLKFPVIMKPEDNQGSRGVFLAYSEEDLIAHIDESLSFSSTGNVIVEEFFEGKEVVVEGFVYNGSYVNWGIADRKYFDINDVFIPSQTIFPSILSEESKKMLIQAEVKIHAELRPSFGMIHSEYLVNEKDGSYILVETALRGGGVYISSHLVPLYTGVDNYKYLLDCGLGKPIGDIKSIEQNIIRKASAYVCFYLPEGEIVSVEGAETLKKMDNVVVADLDNMYVGGKTSRMFNKTQRLGPIVLFEDDRGKIDDLIKRIQNTLKIRVRKPDGSYGGIIWD